MISNTCLGVLNTRPNVSNTRMVIILSEWTFKYQVDCANSKCPTKTWKKKKMKEKHSGGRFKTQFQLYSQFHSTSFHFRFLFFFLSFFLFFFKLWARHLLLENLVRHLNTWLDAWDQNIPKCPFQSWHIVSIYFS